MTGSIPGSSPCPPGERYAQRSCPPLTLEIMRTGPLALIQDSAGPAWRTSA